MTEHKDNRVSKSIKITGNSIGYVRDYISEIWQYSLFLLWSMGVWSLDESNKPILYIVGGHEDHSKCISCSRLKGIFRSERFVS